MASNFKELRATMTPEAQAQARRQADAMLEKMSLHELRKERRRTQAVVAEVMQVGQGAVSKIEQRGASSISTLSSYIRGLGGQLEMRAVFPGKSVILTVQGEE